MSSKRSFTPLGDFFFESISDDGATVFRCPGGSAIELSIPPELVHYYRRLVPPVPRDQAPQARQP